MDSQETWVEALNISSESLSEWGAQAPATVPLLVWCLEMGLVPCEDYLACASERFELPVLINAFFHSFDHHQFEAERQNGIWNPWLFPVGKWDDVTLIACVEPPAEPPEVA